MKKYFEKGQKLKFSDNTIEYEIKDIVGTGSSCAVYLAEGSDGTEHLLKEYNPKHLDVVRDYNGNLFVDSEEDEEAFEIGLKRFRAGYGKQLNIRKWTELRNVISNVQGIYSAYGTKYIDMTFFSGVTFDKVKFSNLYELVRYIRTITRVVGNYHDKGFLHLDIKPENIFTIPETPDLVMLFDFDSVTEKSSIQAGTTLSYTKSWAAPEQVIPGKSKKICEATDIFAIGEMLFYGIYNRHSLPEERRSYYEYKFDGSNELLEGLDKPAAKLLSEILKHTISNSVSNRYQSCNQFEDKLNELIAFTNPEKPEIIDKLPIKSSYFIGREKELALLDEKLGRNNCIYVSGMGGIGKTELVKEYILKNKEKYGHIIYTICSNNLINVIADDKMISIRNFYKQQEETNQEYCSRKLIKLNELLKENDIFIIDNLNDFSDSIFKDIQSFKCKLIITTRQTNDSSNDSFLTVNKENDNNLLLLFKSYYTNILSTEDENVIREIINTFYGHTLLIELLAKQIKNSRISPKELLNKCHKVGISSVGKEKVSLNKDDTISQAHISIILKQVFNLSGLESEKLAILKNMFFVPTSGIEPNVLKKWINLDSYDLINFLIDEGWIKNGDKLTLHPVIQEVLVDYVRENSQEYTVMLDSVTKSIKSEDENSDYSKQVAMNASSLIINRKIDNNPALDFVLDTTILIGDEFENLINIIFKNYINIGVLGVLGDALETFFPSLGGIGAIITAVTRIVFSVAQVKQANKLKTAKSKIKKEDFMFIISLQKSVEERLKDPDNQNNQSLISISQNLSSIIATIKSIKKKW